MMKTLLGCFAFLAVSSLVNCTTTPRSTTSEELISSIKNEMLQNYLREQRALAAIIDRTEKVCPGYGKKIEAAISKVEKCTNDIDEDTETMCSGVRNHFERCLEPVVELFEECLPEKSKDVPSFIIKTVLSISNHLCKSDGEHIFELSNPCARSPSYRTQRCARRIETKLRQYTTNIPDKEHICEFIKSFRGCLQSQLSASCGNVKTREAFLNLYDAGSEACQSPSLNEIELVDTQ